MAVNATRNNAMIEIQKVLQGMTQQVAEDSGYDIDN